MTSKPQNENPVPRQDMTRPQFYRVHPLNEGEEIVISGMSGRFPSSSNVMEFANNLYNKVDMVTEVSERWKQYNSAVPGRLGQVTGHNKFDATFFGVHHTQVNTMDPQCRTILEEAYLAVMDAGVNPNSIRGTKTGVFIASCFSDSEKRNIDDEESQGSFAITGSSRAMYANRISYSLGLRGPSFYIDTACSSSIFAIDVAYAALRNGEIDAAIVGGTSLILHPSITLQFARLGVLSSTGVCSPFDQKANGYVRSEGVAALYLQRKRDACRIYATVVHSKTNCDGYKSEGITYPSGKVQEELLKEFYSEISIPLDDIGYMEAHSTGTVVGDPEECRAIDSAICKKRSEPLLIGSVKSNIGHTEPTSGICSIVKVLHTFQCGKIPPNINFNKAKKEIAALQDGRMKVVSETTELRKPFVGINSFGFGGANAHILLKRFNKEKLFVGALEGSLPRLCIWSGRTKEGVEKVQKKLESKPLDPEYVALLHNLQSDGIPGMVFRGYSILKASGTQMPICLEKEVEHYAGVKRPIVWVFSGMGSQWAGMGSALMEIPMFRQSIQRCYNALKPAGLDLIKILTSNDPKIYDNIVHSFTCIAAIQIALTDILRALGMEPDYIIGHSTGELGCAYADGCFTAEQMILAAYYRGKISLDNQKVKGSMAAVGQSYRAIRGILPDSIEVACHNGPDSCTISGPADDVAQFVQQLQAQGIFAKEVPCSNIAYHTRYIAHLGKDFLKYLKHVIPNPKKRSSKWLSTSVPQKHWSRPESLLSSAEYHTNNLLSSVLFEETSALLPKNCLTIEIAPHALLKSILKSAIPNGVHIGLTQRGNKENHIYFLAALGKLFLNGLNLRVDVLYPKIEWPVSRGTDTISDIVEFDHRDDWDVFSYEKMTSRRSGEKVFFIKMKGDDKYLGGHNIDGKILVPATYYLYIVWKTFTMMYHDTGIKSRNVEMENIKFVRATTLNMESTIELTVMIHFATGSFELIDGDSLVASGTIREFRDAKQPASFTVKPFDTTKGEEFHMSAKDLYKELKLRGYYYSDGFKGVESIRGDGQVARIKWDSNWVTFLDCMLQAQILRKDSRDLCLPTKISKLRLFGQHHLDTVEGKNYVNVYSDGERIVGGGVELMGLEVSSVQRRKPPGLPVLERYQFVPHFPSPALLPEDIGRFFIQLVLENGVLFKLKLTEIMPTTKQSPLIVHFLNAIEELPLITGDYTILSSGKYEDLPANVNVEQGDIAQCKESDFIIDQTGGEVLKLAESLTANSYVALVLKTDKSVAIPSSFTVLANCPLVESGLKLQLLRKNEQIVSSGKKRFLKISSLDTEFQWLKQAQGILASEDLILVAENDKCSGVLGLTNCLRKEYTTKTTVRCVLIDDRNAPAFDPQHPLYANQLALGMAINIYRKGQWGTYRHLKLSTDYPLAPQVGHVYGNVLHRGDLSTIRWQQGAISPEKAQVKVVYTSLNFKDIMLATGRISPEIFGIDRLNQDRMLGMEYSGIDVKTGKKVMGMLEKAAVSSYVDCPTSLTMEVPEHWSLREAATVPVVYLTVYYAFFHRTDIRKGKSILIHAGTGGVGLSAIRIALAYGLEVFTTVSTIEKKNFLLKTYPQLKGSHIGNSRDTSFEAMIKKETNGKGVDFVLNSLAEEKLIASFKCLAVGGVFLEIGKFDMQNDNQLGMAPFLREISFVAVLLDLLVAREDHVLMKKMCDLLRKDIISGIVQPLPSTVFAAKEMEQAFRFLASGKHIGKVLVQVRESAEAKATLPMRVLPIMYFSPDLVYVIPGGLGGFGLELVDWMVVRGARKVVLSSSRGISNGYQSYRIQLWMSYVSEIRISTANISTRHGCEMLLKDAMKLGPIGGIFNLAVVLKDAIFENQNSEVFKESLGPKAFATKHLDELSRQLCPKLQHFVVFSSVSCGRGNPGQTNYGMANSIMERIIEDRVANGLPGKAVEWGAIGEVGLVAVMAEDKIDLEIGGTLQQRISSCLQELDTLLSCPDPIVASMVVAEKRLSGAGSSCLLETVMDIMGIRDPKSVSYVSTLSELGMDSLMAVDIKQTLERDFDLFLSPQDLRSLTLEKLQEYSQDREHHGEERATLEISDIKEQMALMVRNLGDESNFEKILVPVNQGKKGLPPVFIFPGIECSSGQVWLDLGSKCDAPSYVIQLHKTAAMTNDEVVEFAVKQIEAMLKPDENFQIIGYSFGALIATKVVPRLERLGHTGKLMLIDGSPALLSFIYKTYMASVGQENVDALVLSTVVNLLVPEDQGQNTLKEFMHIEGLEGRISVFQKYARRQKVFSEQYVLAVVQAVIQRCQMILDLDLSSLHKINAPICLIKPTIQTVSAIAKDYELSSLTTNAVQIHVLEGNHTTVLENLQLPEIINKFWVTDKS